VNEDEKPKPQETQESEAENIEPEDINEPVEDAIVGLREGPLRIPRGRRTSTKAESC
jgi:hypothetical protein